jgi:hypothetical protein
MTIYIQIQNNITIYPLSIHDLRRMYPQTSFPNSPHVDALIHLGIFQVVETNPPNFDQDTQLCTETVVLLDGQWHQTWTITDLSDVELAEKLQQRRKSMIVSTLQADIALTQFGLLETVEAAVAASDSITQKAWNKALEFRRLSPLIIGLAESLGWTDAQLDELFEAAALIEV